MQQSTPPQSVLAMIGKQYGRLTVLSFAGYRHFPCGVRQPLVSCSCECGGTSTPLARNVRTGHARSCGCLHFETPRTTSRKHGHTANYAASKVYQAHKGMMNRCYHAKTKRYECYGGRGITVCDRWRLGEGGNSGFECFLDDMGEPPTVQHSIDRTDVDGNYEPSNCRWIPMAEQARNRRTNRWLTGFGKTQLMQDWADEYGIGRGLFCVRIVKMGLSVEEAVKSRSQTKLSLEKAREIRRIHEEQGIGAWRLAKMYGVAKGTITFILTGQTWKEPVA